MEKDVPDKQFDGYRLDLGLFDPGNVPPSWGPYEKFLHTEVGTQDASTVESTPALLSHHRTHNEHLEASEDPQSKRARKSDVGNGVSPFPKALSLPVADLRDHPFYDNDEPLFNDINEVEMTRLLGHSVPQQFGIPQASSPAAITRDPERDPMVTDKGDIPMYPITAPKDLHISIHDANHAGVECNVSKALERSYPTSGTNSNRLSVRDTLPLPLGDRRSSSSLGSSWNNTPSSSECLSRASSSGVYSQQMLANSADQDTWPVVPENSSSESLQDVSSTFNRLTTDRSTAPQVSAKPTPKRRKYNDEELTKVNDVREQSACLFCQIVRKPCSEPNSDKPCDRCVNQWAIESSKKLWNLPCFRGRITDVELFRIGSIRFPVGVRLFKRWESKEKKCLQLFFPTPYYLGDESTATPPSVDLECRQFRRESSDLLSRDYNSPDGVVTVLFPAFALSSMPLARQKLGAMVSENFGYFASMLKDSSQPICRLTISEALRHRSSSFIIDGCLRIAIMTRLFSKSFGIRGSETLGIPFSDDPYSPYYGRVPIPPILDAQLDQIWRETMIKLKKQVLARLKPKVLQHKSEDWLETFLSFFILLDNIEFSYRHQRAQLQRQQKVSESLNTPVLSFTTMSMIEKWEHSAHNLLTHFVVACKGQVPFQPDWLAAGNLKSAGLDAISTTYVRNLSHLIEENRSMLEKAAKDVKETPMHWLSGLLIPLQRE